MRKRLKNSDGTEAMDEAEEGETTKGKGKKFTKKSLVCNYNIIVIISLIQYCCYRFTRLVVELLSYLFEQCVVKININCKVCHYSDNSIV